MNLYFVRYEDDEGNNLNLLASAETPEEAVKFWGDYFAYWENWAPDDEEALEVEVCLVEWTKEEGPLTWYDAPGGGGRVHPGVKVISKNPNAPH